MKKNKFTMQLRDVCLQSSLMPFLKKEQLRERRSSLNRQRQPVRKTLHRSASAWFGSFSKQRTSSFPANDGFATRGIIGKRIDVGKPANQRANGRKEGFMCHASDTTSGHSQQTSAKSQYSHDGGIERNKHLCDKMIYRLELETR